MNKNKPKFGNNISITDKIRVNSHAFWHNKTISRSRDKKIIIFLATKIIRFDNNTR
jgi:hypothetical protein